MLFLDGVYVERPDGSLRFRWVEAPTGAELTRLAQILALRIGRYLEWQGLLERDAENSTLPGGVMDEGPMDPLWGHSITYRIAVGPQQGARCLPCRRCRPAMSSSMTEWARWPGSRCMPWWWRSEINTRGLHGCVATSVAGDLRKGPCRLPQNRNLRYQLKTP